MGQASPQPMVMTTSAACTTSSVSGFGNSWDRSSPSSAITATTAGFHLVNRGRAGGTDVHPSAGGVIQQGGGHLGPAGVVHADKQDLGYVGHEHSFGLGGGGQPVGGEPGGQVWQVILDLSL